MGETSRASYLPIDATGPDLNTDAIQVAGRNLAMNGTSAKKGANSQRFYGCAYNENEMKNVRRADGEIDKMYEKDVVTKRHTFPKDDGERLESFTYETKI